MVLDGPFALAVSEVIEPLQEEGAQVDTPLECSAEPPLARGSGALQIGQYHIGEGLPRDDLGKLDQRMCRGDVNGHRCTGGSRPEQQMLMGGLRLHGFSLCCQ